MSRVAVVTGATDGIGRAVAARLASQGFRVLVIGRDLDRGEAVVRRLDAVATAPATAHAFLRADLSSMSATSRLADAVLSLTDHVDALVCSAGVLAMRPDWTDEGLERTFALNYLSRFLLTRRLEPALLRSPSSRVILVANAGRYRDRLDLDDPHYRRGRPGLRVSTRSQFANDLLAVELAARFRGTPVAATCVFPGVARTGVFRHGVGLPPAVVAVMDGIARRFGLTPEAAAETPAWLADSADPALVSESFFGPAREVRRIPDRARRPERRTALWRVSEQLTAPWLTSAHEGPRRRVS
jgi:NAD(P)-dependent dehydrogenase (short-subunit alcohol dehydrogenase family)